MSISEESVKELVVRSEPHNGDKGHEMRGVRLEVREGLGVDAGRVRIVDRAIAYAFKGS